MEQKITDYNPRILKGGGDLVKAIRPIPKVYDARISFEVRKAVEEEFQKRFLDMDTVILWILHKRFGFGPVRLKRYFDAYRTAVKSQQDHYNDLTYEKMREALMHNIGVDVKEWEREI